MALAFDNTLVREPGLLVPRRQPVGRVRVNWDHPLGDGIFYYSVMGGRIFPPAGAGSDIYYDSTQIASSNNGVCRYFPIDGTITLDTSDPNIFRKQTFSHTVVVSFPNTVVSTMTYVCAIDLRLTIGINAEYIGPYLGASYYSGSFHEINGIYYSNVIPKSLYIISVTKTQGGPLRLYINGTAYGATVATGDVVYKHTRAAEYGARHYFAPATNGNALNMYFSVHHDRELSASEIAALHRDPYQFLIPAG